MVLSPWEILYGCAALRVCILLNLSFNDELLIKRAYSHTDTQAVQPETDPGVHMK